MPKESAITFEGIYYDYYFETEKKNDDDMKMSDNDAEDGLFYASYLSAKSMKPQCLGSNGDEYFMTVGLNSNLKQEDFKRNKLNLIIVLDISGKSFNFSVYCL